MLLPAARWLRDRRIVAFGVLFLTGRLQYPFNYLVHGRIQVIHTRAAVCDFGGMSPIV
jgi:hypothetical protein